MSAAKIDHKELERRLKEDELAVYLGSAQERLRSIWDVHSRTLAAGFIIIALVVAGFYLWSVKSNTVIRESQLLFGNATILAQAQSYPQALDQLNRILQEYSGAEIVPAARVLKGDCHFQLKEYDQALNEYRAALRSLNAADAVPVRIAIVQTLRSSGQSEQAIQELDQLYQVAQSQALKEQILYLKGSCYEDLNQPEKALETYQSIDTESSWYSLAQGRIDWLEAQPVAAIN